MKTYTTKELNANVYTYILNAIDNPDSDEILSNTEKLQFVADCFNSEFNYDYNKRAYPNVQDRLANWFMGLPSSINIDFENYRILEIAKEWKSIPENATDRQEQKILDNWFSFIAAKTLQLMRKHNVTIN